MADLFFPLLIGISISLIFFISLSFGYNLQKQQKIRLARFKNLNQYSINDRLKEENKRGSDTFNYRFIPQAVSNYIKRSLETIHSDLRYEIVISQIFLATALLILFARFTSGSLIFAILLGVSLTALAYRQLIKVIADRQRTNFKEDLPELLNILAGGLRAGLSLHQALEAYAAENSGEVSTQVRRALSEISIGNSIDTALMGVAERMHSDDLKWTVTALTIQKTVGGSMATILETAYDTVRGRAEINREVRTISAEGRLSAYVLMALPFGIFTFMFFSRRTYIQVFWTDPIGLFLLAFVGLSMMIGWIWMRKVVEIRI